MKIATQATTACSPSIRGTTMYNAIQSRYQEAPYPQPGANNTPSAQLIYRHSIVTPFHHRDRCLPAPHGRILDFGCGTGVKTLALATSNPGWETIGVDFSARAIHIAKELATSLGLRNMRVFEGCLDDRLEAYGPFDYINCDDVLYLLDDPAAALARLATLLLPDGIIRFNVHNASVRQEYLRAGLVLDLIDALRQPVAETVASTRALYRGLRPQVRLARTTGRGLASDEHILANHALVGDKAFSLKEVFAMVDGAGIDLINFVDFHEWSLEPLFSANSAGAALATKARALRMRERHLFVDCVNYGRRLYDLWCCHAGRSNFAGESLQFDEAVRQNLQLCVHPALEATSFLAHATERWRSGTALDLAQFIPLPRTGVCPPIAAAPAALAIAQHKLRACDLVRWWTGGAGGEVATQWVGDGNERLAAGVNYLIATGAVLVLL